MKRSEINKIIKDAIAFLDEHKFLLPPFAYFTPEEWKEKNHEYDEIRNNVLGWDITDFGSGDFHSCGLFLFTLRNGNAHNPDDKKVYAEKIMIVEENQVTPYHYHWYKQEDIINRGGATCADVVALTEQVRQIVEARTGFVLEREIRVVK